MARQDRVDGRSQFFGFGLPPGGYRLYDPFEILCSENGDYPRRVTGCRSIDRRDVGVRVGAAEHRGVEHGRQLHVVEKSALACEQSGVLKPFYRLAGVDHWGLLSVWGTMVSKALPARPGRTDCDGVALVRMLSQMCPPS